MSYTYSFRLIMEIPFYLDSYFIHCLTEKGNDKLAIAFYEKRIGFEELMT